MSGGAQQLDQSRRFDGGHGCSGDQEQLNMVRLRGTTDTAAHAALGRADGPIEFDGPGVGEFEAGRHAQFSVHRTHVSVDREAREVQVRANLSMGETPDREAGHGVLHRREVIPR